MSTPDQVVEPKPETAEEGPVKPTPFKGVAQFFAFGFGSGLSPKAPGTVGTLAAVPFYWYLADTGLVTYTLVVLISAVVGVYICGVASRQLKVHDHPGIVWDEFVGFWITMWAVPVSIPWLVAGFVVFRVFDIAKPWPISVLDKRVHGGLGIMIDDVVAGLAACGTLHLALWMS
jgi:phosphatidylglycerophosphatase A